MPSTVANSLHSHLEIVPGVIAAILWVFVVMLGKLAGGPLGALAGNRAAPASLPRFQVTRAGAVESLADIPELAGWLERQPAGEEIKILDRPRNRMESVQVAADGSIWEYYGSRHSFDLQERFGGHNADEATKS